MCNRTQEKGAVTSQKSEPNLPVSVQESLAEVWVEECNSACISSFEGGCNYLISLASGKLWQTKLRQTKLRQTKQLHPSMENWIKDLPGMTPPIRTTPFLIGGTAYGDRQSLLSGSFHSPIILIQQRADRMKTTITEN